jgi:molybdopterin converting factor small subunit
MSIKVSILYPPLQRFTDNQEVVKANGRTVGECLDHLVKQFPGIEKGLFDRYGQLLNYVHFFINGKGAYPPDLAKMVKDGDELTISLLLPGG